MSPHAWLLAWVPGLPLLLLLACAFVPRPARLLAFAPLPGLAVALSLPAGTGLALPQALLGAGLRLDATGAVFLGFCAFLWCCAGAYAVGYLAGKPGERTFCGFWLLTLAGSLGVCIAADMVSFYLFFAALSLSAWGLVVHDRSPASRRAGRIYITMAVAGETALLAGLMLGAQAAGSIDIDAVREALPQARWRDAAVAALLIGLGLKAGLLPLHGWLPLAHSFAPVPASAVLSGAIVKAGILGLLRFLPMDGAIDSWGSVIGWLGLATAWAGVLLGLPQRRPKAVLAYSTMSQMGLLVAVIGVGMAATGGAAATQAAATFYGLHHGLTKGALFLAVGLAAGAQGGAGRVLFGVVALLGLAMAGAPLTGGALAKLAIKGPLGEGAVATLAGLSAVGTLLLMLRFMYLLRGLRDAPDHATRGMAAAFTVLALAALVLPWWAVGALAGKAAGDALSGVALWGAAWPVLLALALALPAWRGGWRSPVPVPVGDMAATVASALVRGQRQARRHQRVAVPAWVRPGLRASLAARLAGWGQSLGERLSTWPVGGGALALMAVVLGLALRG